MQISHKDIGQRGRSGGWLGTQRDLTGYPWFRYALRRRKLTAFGNYDLVACRGFPRDSDLTCWLHACRAAGMSASSNFGCALILCWVAGSPGGTHVRTQMQ